MSGETVAIIIEGLLLGVALLFLVAVLRSHAEILRRLALLENESGTLAARGAAGTSSHEPAGEIVGTTPAGDAVKLNLGPGAPRTLLAFLSTGCAACGPLWSGLHQSAGLSQDARLVVVTKGPERERSARLLELAPVGAEVIMSTDAWEHFAVPATPHFVLVSGEEGILGRGSATSWEQIASLLHDAADDAAVHPARTTEQRAAWAEQALAAAGIGARHPSLYPSMQAHPADEERGND
jgi:hypothetical protein